MQNDFINTFCEIITLALRLEGQSASNVGGGASNVSVGGHRTFQYMALQPIFKKCCVPDSRAKTRAPLTCLLAPVDPSFRALSGRLKFTVRRHKFNKYSISLGDGRAFRARTSTHSAAPLRSSHTKTVYFKTLGIKENESWSRMTWHDFFPKNFQVSKIMLCSKSHCPKVLIKTRFHMRSAIILALSRRFGFTNVVTPCPFSLQS